MTCNIAVIGSGGREHALCWKLNQSNSVSNIYAIPGNGGTAKLARTCNVELNINDTKEFISWLNKNNVQVVIVGPEIPLANGLCNVLQNNEILCFGPTKEAARIEWDKEWAKEFMDKHGIPTARWESFTETEKAKEFIKNASYDALVIKAAGLAQGKGVTVAKDKEEACSAVDSTLGSSKLPSGAASVIVVEELLDGEEVSVLAFTDGNTVKAMLPVQDHKRLLDGDDGPNTGGMGAFCPFFLSNQEKEYIQREILEKTVLGLKKDGIPFLGVLYAGLMITHDGIKVLEFNCRFGDPETQVLMPLLESDLFTIIKSCCNKTLHECQVNWKKEKFSAGVVMATKEYPNTTPKPVPVQDFNHEPILVPGTIEVFHGNTTVDRDEKIIARGGRIFNVVAVDQTLIRAAKKATDACEIINFDGKQFRKDIARKGILRDILKRAKLTYSSAGVDISCGNEIIKNLKSLIESTYQGASFSPIGSYGAVIDANLDKYTKPILVTGTDGVGTKLKIAQQCQNHSTIGQDLVAMSVNDILAHGAKPLFFLDYYACGKLDAKTAQDVISSVIKGCIEAGCALVGGETAEMPGFYKPLEYDLAGFAVGVVEKKSMLPKEIRKDDVILYLSSSGIHSNGFSLVRKIMRDRFQDMSSIAPFSQEGKTFEEELLKPTKIYAKKILPLMEQNLIKAFAHITGGGLVENIPRVLPSNLKVDLDATLWNILPIFGWISAFGGVSEEEMLRTFNCGIGAIVIVDKSVANRVAGELGTNIIGKVIDRNSEKEPQVIIRHFGKALRDKMDPFFSLMTSPEIVSYKRVAVLISGTGTNLKALIEDTLNDALTPARIVYVISNVDGVKGLKIAAEHGIPTEVIPKSENDNGILEALNREKIDLVCLAGYMRLLSRNFVERWRGKCINIHPSLLPAFRGMHTHRKVLQSGARYTGCTVHFVEVEVDSGGIIEQAVVPVKPNDNEELLAERVKVEEHKIFPRVLRMLAADKIELDLQSGKVIRRYEYVDN